MDIVFQSGEFYNEDNQLWTLLNILASIATGLISAWIAIYIFRRGVKIEKLRELEKEDERLRDLEEYIKANISLLSRPIDKQVESYLRFTKKLKSKVEQDYDPEEITSLHTKNLKRIDHTDFYKIFVTRKKGELQKRVELFQYLSADIDFIDTSLKSFRGTLKYFKGKYELYISLWNRNMTKINELKNFINVDVEIAKTVPEQDPFYITMNKIFKEFPKKKDYTEPDVAIIEFIEPLRKLCDNQVADRRAVLMSNLSMKCFYAHQNLTALKHFTWRIIVDKAIQLRKSKKRMTKTLKEIDELK